jgi:hypothetical protein
MAIEQKELVTRFVSAVQSQNQCIDEGAPERGNQFALAYIEAGKALLSGGNEGIDLFAGLLKHEDPGVRVMAGAFLLETRTSEVVAALEPISHTQGIAALGARMALDRYGRGELSLRFDERC